MMVSVKVDVDVCMRRVNVMSQHDWPVAMLLDLRKAFPKLSKIAFWGSLEKYCFNDRPA